MKFAHALLLGIAMMVGCRRREPAAITRPSTPADYRGVQHSTPEEALQALRRFSVDAKNQGGAITYEDAARILSPFIDGARVVDTAVSAGIARSQFDLKNGVTVSIRMSESREPSNKWVIFEIVEIKEGKRKFIYKRSDQK